MTTTHLTDLGQAAADLKSRSWRMLIDGELVEGADTVPVINPATEEVLAQSPVADEGQVNDAVRAASNAFPAWRDLTPTDRGRYLKEIADAIAERADEFALIVTLEQGKTLEASRGDVDAAIAFTNYFASLRPAPEILRDDEEARIQLRRKPLGVVAAILPWNFPFFQGMYKLAPALLMGNTMVMKPAPTTPLNAMLLGELLRSLLPPGVVNIVGDSGNVGPMLTGHPDVAKISFTGSTVTGKAVMANAVPTLKRVTLELGGNDAAIVLDDVDVPAVAQELFKWAFFNCGQVCINIKRIYAPAAMYDELCDEIARLAKAAKVGDGTDPDTQIGPIQNAKQYDAVRGYLERAREDGTIIAGGNVIDRPGFFVEPTVVRDISDQSPLARQETFGPIRSILKYETVDDAIERANATSYGLGNSVWSNDLGRAMKVADRLESGTTWINQHFAIQPDVPFGGRKQSGIGVEFGTDGINEFTAVHVINMAKTSVNSRR